MLVLGRSCRATALEGWIFRDIIIALAIPRIGTNRVPVERGGTVPLYHWYYTVLPTGFSLRRKENKENKIVQEYKRISKRIARGFLGLLQIPKRLRTGLSCVYTGNRRIRVVESHAFSVFSSASSGSSQAEWSPESPPCLEPRVQRSSPLLVFS